MSITIKCTHANGGSTVSEQEVELDDTVESLFVLLAIALEVEVDHLRLTRQEHDGKDTPLANSEATWAELGITAGSTVHIVVSVGNVHADPVSAAPPTAAANKPMTDEERIMNLFGGPKPQQEEQLPIDIDSAEVQQKLYEAIQRKNIEENLEKAYEYNPELFATQYLLYVKCFINGEEVNALIDTGAMSSILSKEVAERCNLMRLVDTRVKTRMVGVGENVSLGKIHVTPVEMEGEHMSCAFHVMDNMHIPAIIALDSLRRHRMVVDLDAYCLRMGEKVIPFLSDAEVEKLSAQVVLGDKEEEEDEAKKKTKMEESKTTEKTKPTPTSTSPPSKLSADQEEKVKEFSSFTGAPRAVAVSFLSMAEWEMELAVSLYTDSLAD
ncbi:Aspartyl protease/gag-polyprotein putative aspartyl protease/UBA-like domain containing protein, putative [Angomonas deanei]|uniref:Aspartyl protease/gag-polyprotein putative aspartyl protease/UBA-like domain containing protein, putative n=1 Tax=Angomonas deanei TaxID=59799 RepID=A0A7G2CPD0_9TRYP|nr:Aspartyl protease/gag-polyprotein putative aspartyl protease/UBA-like domain containing protein, putative [Angomonas deanei]